MHADLYISPDCAQELEMQYYSGISLDVNMLNNDCAFLNLPLVPLKSAKRERTHELNGL